MSRISKTKSRPIEINGTKYRWMISGKSRYISNTPTAVTITVQIDSENPGTVLQCVAVSKVLKEIYPGDGDRGVIHKATVYPSDIEGLVKFALDKGWVPEDRKGTGVFRPGDFDMKDFKAI